MVATSFYAPVPEGAAADDFLADYERFLVDRNGTLDAETGFEQRDDLMADLASLGGSYDGPLDEDVVRAGYAGAKPVDLRDEELALLSFVKINAGEAYGVEVTTTARAKLYERDEPIFRVEKVLAHEETFHTKMLLGITQHFGNLDLGDGWTPPMPLKVLIFALAKSPPALFHPILLGSEIAGVFTLNWLLERSRELFPDHPEIRESMERRLVEILIDEIGHIAYNRIAIGQRGLKFAKPMAGQVVRGQELMTPEVVALGLDRSEQARLDSFDYTALPEEVRRRSFFV